MEAGSADNVFVPQVFISRIPKIGQEFESHEEAYKFYNDCAREAGFSAPMANSKKKRDTNETYWKLFVCSKEGKTNETYQKKQKDTVVRVGKRNRGQTQIGCNSKLSVVKQQMGHLWVVNKFVEEHNHALTTPSRVHLLRSHRHGSTTNKVLSQQFSEANIPTCQQIRLMEIDSGGPPSIGCVERDLRNYEQNIREEVRGHDAETFIELFTFEKEKSPNFFFDYETDSKGKLVRCFWANSKLRRSYAFFGDVVVFDNTYNTNKYSMIFAPFVGVNHYGQTILFACGLLVDETIGLFVWLFSKFLEAMPAQAPQILIMDQDAAIAEAISIVLPGTFHRLCLWHILNKFLEKMNVTVHNEQYHTLINIIRQSESPEEFEANWAAVMEDVDLASNEWLCTMYDIRGRWVKAYVKHMFSAGMSSSQKSESGHSFFKRCRTFDFDGYPCRHMISYWRKKQVLLVPDKYILRRWTKNVKVSCVGDSALAFGTDDCSSTSLMSRHGLLAHKASLIVDDAALTDARSTYLMGEFEALHLRVKDIDDGCTISWRQNKNVNRDDSVVILDPNPVRAKGCGKRLKSSKEKAIAKGNRQCRMCGHVGHDKRTCPRVVERCTTDTSQRVETDYVCTEDNVVQDDGTFASNASSHHGVVEWFL
ncbi:Protein FAR1-RELATED SEQUENCE 5 [Abeliophyllum distichum]|uniref:Protein FAR1-RELATED SEQUENCE 5 n=1 Tax=Abeliophyllum distichum TaxID=126358 RepID=A0ABD1TEI6_9LAMI